MSASQIFRVCAVVLLVGGVMGLAGGISGLSVSDLSQASSPLAITSGIMSMLGALLVILGLPGAYARIARDAGWIGLLGIAGVMMAAIGLGYFFSTLQVLVFPWIASLPLPASAMQGPPPNMFAYMILGNLITLVGAGLLGIAIIRTAFYSRWLGYYFILAGILSLVTGLVPDAPPIVQSLGGDLFSIAGIWLGYELWQTAGERDLLGA